MAKGFGGGAIIPGGGGGKSVGMGIQEIMPFIQQNAMLNALGQKSAIGANNLGGIPTYATERNDLYGNKSETNLGLQQKVLQQQEEDKQKSQFDMQRIANVLSNSTALQKASFLEKAQGPYTKNIPSFGVKGWDVGGPLKGAVADFAGNMGSEDYSASAGVKGQAESVVLALSPILTGQNRVIEGITNKLGGIVAGANSTPGTLAEKNAILMRDAYGFSRALSKAGFTPEKLSQLSDQEASDPNHPINQQIKSLPIDTPSPEEMQMLEPHIARVNATPPMQKHTLPFPELDALRNQKSPIPGMNNQQSSSQMRSFNTEEEAMASGYKGRAIIGKRQATIS